MIAFSREESGSFTTSKRCKAFINWLLKESYRA
jgi:hypothetical protein